MCEKVDVMGKNIISLAKIFMLALAIKGAITVTLGLKLVLRGRAWDLAIFLIGWMISLYLVRPAAKGTWHI